MEGRVPGRGVGLNNGTEMRRGMLHLDKARRSGWLGFRLQWGGWRNSRLQRSIQRQWLKEGKHLHHCHVTVLMVRVV